MVCDDDDDDDDVVLVLLPNKTQFLVVRWIGRETM